MSKAKQQNIWYLQNLARHYEKLQHPYIHQESKDLIYYEAHLDHIACFSSGLLFSPAAYSPKINWGWSLLVSTTTCLHVIFWVGRSFEKRTVWYCKFLADYPDHHDGLACFFSKWFWPSGLARLMQRCKRDGLALLRFNFNYTIVKVRNMKETSPLMHSYSKVRSPAPMRSCANKKTRGFSKLFSAPTQPGWGLFLGRFL